MTDFLERGQAERWGPCNARGRGCPQVKVWRGLAQGGVGEKARGSLPV